VHRTYPCDPQSVARFINLDFNASKWLIGIEVWECGSKRLPAALLRDAQILGDEDVISPGSQREAELQQSDEAVVYLRLSERGAAIASKYKCDGRTAAKGLTLCFGPDGHLIGIEVRNWSRRLPDEVLREARLVG